MENEDGEESMKYESRKFMEASNVNVVEEMVNMIDNDISCKSNSTYEIKNPYTKNILEVPSQNNLELLYNTSLDNTKTEITDLYPSEMTDGNSNATYTDNDWDQINVNATLGAQDPFVTKGFSSPP